MKRARREKRSGHSAMARISRSIDLLAVFDNLNPWLVKLLNDRPGITAEEIYKEAASVVAARGVNIALNERDSGKAISAIKDVLDRAHGKARERTEHTHRLEKVPDQELDAVLLTKLQDLNAAERKLKN